MATLREIRQRITGVKNTQQITKAMKMVAAAKMRRAQERMFAARPYALKIGDLIQHLISGLESWDGPLLQQRPVQHILLVAVTGDRGLCGSFNSNVIKKTVSEVKSAGDAQVSLMCLGRKGHDFFRKRDYRIDYKSINFFNDLQYAHGNQAAEFLMREFIAGRVDEVRLIYNEFKSVAQQQLITETILPMRLESEEHTVQSVDYLYEPSREAILNALLPRYLRVQVWRALLESFASEQAARMMAMENATDNANEMIQNLTLQFNKARQAAITKEILEIVGGAEALKSG